MLKQRLNTGKRSNLYFYKETRGKEIDIIREEPSGLDLYEIKSSSTFNKTFTDNLNYLKAVLGEKVRSAKVVYNGDPIPPIAINIREI